MKKLFLIFLVALFAVVTIDEQRYVTQDLKNRLLAVELLQDFHVGSGNATDTTFFTTTEEYGTLYWNGEFSFKVTSLMVGIQSGIGTDTLGIHICWSDTINDATPSYLNTAALALNATTSAVLGQEDTTFDDATIPKGSFVWMRLTDVTAGRKPIELSVTVSGYMLDKPE